MNSSPIHMEETPCMKDTSKDITPVVVGLEDPSVISARTCSNIGWKDQICAAATKTEQHMSSIKKDFVENKSQINLNDDVECKLSDNTRFEDSPVYADLAAIPPGTDCLHTLYINFRHALS